MAEAERFEGDPGGAGEGSGSFGKAFDADREIKILESCDGDNQPRSHQVISA